jgi:hypothetical protein
MIITGHHGNRYRSLFSPKIGIPGSGWFVESEQRLPRSGGGELLASVFRSKDARRVLVYHWYEATGGLLDETLRSFLALDTSPWHRSTDGIAVRLSTELVGSGDLERLGAERRLSQFSLALRRPLRAFDREERRLRAAVPDRAPRSALRAEGARARALESAADPKAAADAQGAADAESGTPVDQG